MFSKKQVLRILIVALLSGIGTNVVMYDQARVVKDFNYAKSVLMNVRNKSFVDNKKRIAKFQDKTLTIYESDAVIFKNTFSTLSSVNYNTSLGDNMIVYDGMGTNLYNNKVHGGDITFRSWLGFKRSLWINCTGYAVEGVMAE